MPRAGQNAEIGAEGVQPHAGRGRIEGQRRNFSTSDTITVRILSAPSLPGALCGGPLHYLLAELDMIRPTTGIAIATLILISGAEGLAVYALWPATRGIECVRQSDDHSHDVLARLTHFASGRRIKRRRSIHNHGATIFHGGRDDSARSRWLARTHVTTLH